MPRGTPVDVFSIYQIAAPTGKWQASQNLVIEVDGVSKRKRITGTGDTPREAQARFYKNLTRYNQRLNAGITIRRKPPVRAAQRLTVGDWFYEWAAALNPDEISETVKRKYIRAGELHIIPHIGLIPMIELSEDQLEKLFNHTLRDKKKADGSQLLSNAGRATIYKVLSVVLNRGVVKNKIPFSPMKSVKKPIAVKPDEPVSQRAQQAKGLILILRNHPEEARWMLSFLGLRKSEALGLTWSCITNLNRKERQAKLSVKQQLARYENGDGYYIKNSTKTVAGTREIPLVGVWLEALQRYKLIQDEWKKSPDWKPKPGLEDLIFTQKNGGFISQNVDNQNWHNLLESNGYPYWRSHMNRWVTATLLAEMRPEVPLSMVKIVLGHSSQAMSSYYTKIGTTSMVAPLSGYSEVLVERRTKQDAKKALLPAPEITNEAEGNYHSFV